MNSNQLMTVGAVGFAGFALWWITRTKGAVVAAQPAQAVRDFGLQSWVALQDAQQLEMSQADVFNKTHIADFFSFPKVNP
jgi:hypothetical protein